jgi:hypothetical protein
MATGKANGFARSIVWLFLLLLFGLVMTLVTARMSLLTDDPFSGVAYRGIPFPFWKFPPKWDSVQAWQIQWPALIMDALVWTLPVLIPLFLRRVIRDERSRKWAINGRCRGCGYDLRGLLSTRCPECGTGNDPAKNDDDASSPT